jgi:HlyD family secretion protein
MRRSRRAWWWLLAIIPVAALIWFGKQYLDSRSQASDTSGTTQIVAVTRGNVTASIDPTGQVEAVRSVSLTFDVDRVTLLSVAVSAGQTVKAGDVLATVDTDPLERNVQQAQASLLSAQDALDKAQNPYTELDKTKAALDVSTAQTSLQAAQQSLSDLTTPDLTDAQTAVSNAQVALQKARNDLAKLKADTSVQDQIDVLQWKFNVAEFDYVALQNQAVRTDLGDDKELLAYNKMMDAKDTLETTKLRAQINLLNAQNSVTQAEQKLATAEQSLADLQAGPDALELAQANNKVAQAEYDLAKAQDTASKVEAGPSADDIQVAQASYNDAQATLEDAQAALDNATMVAPYDGTVISVGAEAGDVISSKNVIVTLADLSELRVVASIDETEITKIKVGMAASITFDSLSGQTFTGTVLEVPLQSTLSSNVVTYAVPISLEGTADAGLRSGMTANVTIVTGQKQDVLLLPILAVQESDTGNVVTLSDGSTTPVELGINDGEYVEISRGLNEGDQVLVTYTTTPSSSQRGFDTGGGGFVIQGGGQPPAF